MARRPWARTSCATRWAAPSSSSVSSRKVERTCSAYIKESGGGSKYQNNKVPHGGLFVEPDVLEARAVVDAVGPAFSASATDRPLTIPVSPARRSTGAGDISYSFEVDGPCHPRPRCQLNNPIAVKVYTRANGEFSKFSLRNL
jgi:hypothetical protein